MVCLIMGFVCVNSPACWRIYKEKAGPGVIPVLWQRTQDTGARQEPTAVRESRPYVKIMKDKVILLSSKIETNIKTTVY